MARVADICGKGGRHNYNVMSPYGGTVPFNKQQGVATTTVHHVKRTLTDA